MQNSFVHIHLLCAACAVGSCMLGARVKVALRHTYVVVLATYLLELLNFAHAAIKRGKSEHGGLISDHLIFAPSSLICTLAPVITALLRHGHS